MRIKVLTNFILCILCIVSLLPVAVSCSSPTPVPSSPSATPATPATPAPQAKWPETITFGTAQVGTSAYTVVVGLCEIISKNAGVKAVAQASTTGAIVSLLNQKQLDIGQVTIYDIKDAITGTGTFKDKGKMPAQHLWFANQTASMMIVRADSGIKTVADMKGKKIATISSGTGFGTFMGEMLLDTAGLTHKDVGNIEFVDFSDASVMLKQGRIDGFITLGPAQGISARMMQLAAELPYRILSAPKDALQKQLQKNPGYSLLALNGKDYKEMTDNQDLTVLACPLEIVAQTQLPDDLVYAVVKAVLSNIEKAKTYHAIAEEWLINPLSALPPIPFHPGAIKYYKEKGLWTAELEKHQQTMIKDIGINK